MKEGGGGIWKGGDKYPLRTMELQNSKLVFLILKIWQYGGWRRWVEYSLRCSCKIWYKNWYLHFYKTYDHQIWQAGASTGLDSNETNQAVTGDVITSTSRDKLKPLYLHYQSVYDYQTWQDGSICGYQTWQDGNLPWWAPAYKVTWPFDYVVLIDHVTN